MDDEILVSHTQKLTPDQDLYTNEIQWAMKRKGRGFIRKSKAVQMIIDYCRAKGIKPEEFIK